MGRMRAPLVFGKMGSETNTKGNGAVVAENLFQHDPKGYKHGGCVTTLTPC
jgi:hypothetical protein